MKDLSIYLNDHLAGSTGAVEMLDHLKETHEGEPIEQFLADLRADIEADQRELKQLMEQFGIGESTVRKAGAWMVEKFSRAKLRVGDAGEPSLALLQSLESLSLGISGKRSLWRSLGAAAGAAPRLRVFDFARLEKRAGDQFERVEAQALELARKIFGRELTESAEK